MKDAGSEDKQIMLNVIHSRDLQESCRAGWQDDLCSIKHTCEQGEIGFVKARICHAVTGTEVQGNDRLNKRVSHEGGQKWQYFREVMQKQGARARHSLEARTKGLSQR